MRVIVIMVSVRIMMKVKTKGFVPTMLWLQFKWGFFRIQIRVWLLGMLGLG